MRQAVTFLLSVRFVVPFLLLLVAVGATLNDFPQDQQYACAVTCGPASQVTNTWLPSHTHVDIPLMVPFANSTSNDSSKNSSENTNDQQDKNLLKQSGVCSGSSSFKSAEHRTSIYFARTFRVNNGYRDDGMKSSIQRMSATLEREPIVKNFAPDGPGRFHTPPNTPQRPLKKTFLRNFKMSGGSGAFLA